MAGPSRRNHGRHSTFRRTNLDIEQEPSCKETMTIFISHVAADSEVAATVAETLRRSGHRIVTRDTSEKALEGANAMLVVASSAAADSPFVRREIEFALQSKRYENRIIPLMVGNTDRLPWILGTFKSYRAGTNVADVARQIADALQEPA